MISVVCPHSKDVSLASDVRTGAEVSWAFVASVKKNEHIKIPILMFCIANFNLR
jgi:hypothetical protein